jgi:hypothetical protein
MEPKDKHNIFSKEEFFKRIDEKRSLPPEADDFDKEALEGLAMITDRKKLDTLNESIDEVLRREALKEKRKRSIYYFSAAASLLLIVGLFFLLKENTFTKKDTGLAVNAQHEAKDSMASVGQKPASDAEVPDEKAPEGAAALGKKEEKAKEGKVEMQLREKVASGETFATDVTTVNTPVAEQENKLEAYTKNPAFKSSNGNTRDNADMDDKAPGQGGKGDAISLSETQKNQPDKAADEKKVYKETAEEGGKDKYRYETNTVWTTPPKEDKKVVDELKKKNAEVAAKKPEVVSNDSRNGVNALGGVATTTNAAPVQVQQNQQVTANEKEEDRSKQDISGNVTIAESKATQGPQKSQHAKKKRKLKKANEPATGAEKDQEKAGYAYYSQTGARSFTSPTFAGGNEALQKFVKENLGISSPAKSGTLEAQFTIMADGSVDAGSIKIITPLKDCEACSKDVIELIKKMPKWQAASENGKPKAYLQKLSVPYNTAASAK